MKKILTIFSLSLLFMMGISDGQTRDSKFIQNPSLWGLTGLRGGYSYSSILFSINGDGTNYIKRHDFVQTHDIGSLGTLLLANNNKLYGMTINDGVNGEGTIYSYDPITHVFTSLYEFTCNYGCSPQFNALIQASNGLLYSTAGYYYGTTGALFSFDPTTNNYTELYNFLDPLNGETTSCTLVQATNGILYGMTEFGGSDTTIIACSSCPHGAGVIFSFDPSNNTYAKVHDFNLTNGGCPLGNSLIVANNGILYGMTTYGGPDTTHSSKLLAFQDGLPGNGVLFSFDIGTNTYTVLHNFDSLNGSNPAGALYQANDGKLYGLTSHGGINYSDLAHGEGVLFSYDIASNTFTKLFDFNDSTGMYAYGSLMQASNNLLYGMNQSYGHVFSFDISNDSLKTIHTFNFDVNGLNPVGNLIELPANVGIPSITDNNPISISPNPASNQITLHSQFPILNSQFIITDITGREILSQIINKQSSIINVSQFPNGIYLYQLKEPNETHRGKFIIQKP